MSQPVEMKIVVGHADETMAAPRSFADMQAAFDHTERFRRYRIPYNLTAYPKGRRPWDHR